MRMLSPAREDHPRPGPSREPPGLDDQRPVHVPMQQTRRPLFSLLALSGLLPLSIPRLRIELERL
jgi:hypothetical protein